MRFVFVIDIESDVQRKDIALAMRRTASSIERSDDPFEEGDRAPVRDLEMNLIGEWSVVAS